MYIWEMADKTKYLMVVLLAITLIKTTHAEDNHQLLQKTIATYSYQQIVCLNIGEHYTYTLKSGAKRIIQLVSVKEHRDSVMQKARWAEVVVKIDTETVTLMCAPYVMPTEVNGLRIQADTTSGWLEMPKRVQFSLWDATDPIVKADQFAFPLPDYRLYSHGMQNYNEVVHLGPVDGNPNGYNFYHNYGIDLAGYDGGEHVFSPVEGTLRNIWPSETNFCCLNIEDENGFVWDLCHFDSIFPGLEIGVPVKKGQPLGMLGKTGPPGTFSHLHVGTYLTYADAQVDRRNLRLNLYPWFVAAYKELPHHQNLIAVARPHHSLFIGDTVRFDGSNSLAFGSKIVNYTWQYHDGENINKAVAERKFDRPGTYIAALVVKDDKGAEDIDFCKVKVYPRSGQLEGIPTIFMTYTPTANIAVGQPINFQIRLMGADEKIPIKIDFGDGTTIDNYLSYTKIQHKFQTTGLHVITAQTTVNDLPIMQKQKVIVSEMKSKGM